jgi:hypothetical protein
MIIRPILSGCFAIALVGFVAALSATPANAASTTKQLACIKTVGYMPGHWNARRVPPGPAARYRACRDKK